MSIRAIAISLRALMEIHPPLLSIAGMIDLAVTEAMNNIVLHAYSDSEGEMRLLAKFVDDTITITIIDTGKSPNLDRIAEHLADGIKMPVDSIDSLQSSGRGLALISQIMDDIQHYQHGVENHVVMTRLVKE